MLNGKDTYYKTFIVDYTGCPIEFMGCLGSVDFNSGQPPRFMTNLPPMGEADIKFLRWSDHFRGDDMIAFSIDGDFIPIALIRREQQLLQRKLFEQEQAENTQLLDANTKKPRPPHVANITIYRIKYRAPGSASAAAAPQKNANNNNKRQKLIVVQGKNEGGALGLAMPNQQQQQEEETHPKKERFSAVREWEYVDIPKLHKAMQEAFSRISPMLPRNPLHKFHYMRMLSVLIGLSGTDFSRGLPFVGPGTLWSIVCESGATFSALLRAYDLKTGLLDTVAARDSLACNIYMHKFASHFQKDGIVAGTKKRKGSSSSSKNGRVISIDCSSEEEEEEDQEEETTTTTTTTRGLQGALNVLEGSSLSERTRRDLPSAFRVEVGVLLFFASIFQTSVLTAVVCLSRSPCATSTGCCSTGNVFHRHGPVRRGRSKSSSSCGTTLPATPTRSAKSMGSAGGGT